MSQIHFRARNGVWIGVGALLLLVVPWSLVHARKAIDERHPADPQGSVEIVNVAGSVAVSGWDRPEVEVTGTAGDQVERVTVTTSGTLTSIHVESGSGWGLGHSGEAHLVVRVPAKSAVSATLVSADLKLSGVQGDVNLQTVSGDVSGDVGGNVRANTVSGGVQLTAPSAKSIEIRTISGDILLTGGGGEVEITTVSGNARIDLATLTRGRLKTVSGDMSATLALAPDGQVDGESVSGNFRFEFPSVPAAEFDVQSFSGDIHNCFGPKPMQPQYGPGSRLTFNNGDSHAHVRVATKSGDVNLCAKGGHLGHVSVAPGVRSPARRMDILYVI